MLTETTAAVLDELVQIDRRHPLHGGGGCTVRFTVGADDRPRATAQILGEVGITAPEGFLEDVLTRLARMMAPRHPECCFTCQWSDYQPAGNPFSGMRCHRDVKTEYRAVRGKQGYSAVPVTEWIPEFYRCSEYTDRVPGTGYRG